MSREHSKGGLAAMDAEAKRELLGQLLRKAADVSREPFELSSGQEALWFLHQLAPQSTAYNVPFCVRLSSEIDEDRFEYALRSVLERHPMLRSTLVLAADGPRQRTGSAPQSCLERIDASQWSEEELRAQVEKYHLRPFDLTRGPLFRATLFRRRDARHVLLLSAHHIVFDGWSAGIVLSEMSAFYEGADPGSLPPVKASFADYVKWQRTLVDSDEGQRAWEYWRARLSNVDAVELPADHARPSSESYRGSSFEFTLEPSVADQIRTLARAESATPYIVLATAFHVLLHRYSGAPEVPIGTPLSGRSRPEFENLVGYFVNPVVICAPIEPGTTFRQHLAAMREAAVSAQRYGDFPFPELVKRLRPERDSSRTPLFQVMLNLIKTSQAGMAGGPLQPHGSTGLRLGSAALQAFPLTQRDAPFDLDLTLLDTGFGMPASLKYSTDLYEGETIARMAGHFVTLLASAIESPDRPVAELPMLTGAERAAVLAYAEGPQLEYRRDLCVHNLIENQTLESPDSVAVVCRGDQISYRELEARANRLANYLRSLGGGAEVLVAVCLERSIDLVVALLGILKAGSAYLPVDPKFPPERIAFMLEDSGAALFVTAEQFLANLPQISGTVVCVDRDRGKIRRQSSTLSCSGAGPANLMYVIYTSGSTGKPKGVQITHGAVANFLASMRREPGIRPGDRLLAVTTISFDIAGLEIYLPLTCGACVILTPAATVADGTALAGLIQTSRPNLMQATPATWRMLLEAGWRGLPGLKILCGGEALSRELANRLLAAGDEVWNLYGPTETTIWSMIHKLDTRETSVPIGRPIANTNCYVLDSARQPVPAGVPGELYIGGDGLARGYLNRPSVTAEKFVPSPFQPGRRLYRTGDLAVYLPDGNMAFLGRLDNQVKLRGFRIELGEIETALERQPGVRQAIVIVREDLTGDPRLVAYVTEHGGEQVDTAELRRALAAELPAYMLPSAFVRLAEFPLTANRKVDRRALPAPDHRSHGYGNSVRPVTAIERGIAEIWQDLLGAEQVGLTDNFFELGGHSLLVAQLQRRLRERFGSELTLMQILGRPTVAGIADLISAPATAVPLDDARWNCLVPVRPGDSRTPIFLVAGYTPNAVEETMLILSRMAAHLKGDQPVYGLRPRWVSGGKAYRDIEEMALECLSEMRTVQPSGPYLLGGYCFAGSVAMEIAQKLVRDGEEVRLLALIDCLRPNGVHALLIELINLGDYLWRRGKHICNVIGDILTAKAGPRKELLSELLASKLSKRRSKNTARGAPSSQDLFEHHRRLLIGYRPKPYSGPISLYVCEEWYSAIVAHRWHPFERYMGWQGIAKDDLSVYKVAGDHQALLTVHSDQLARLLTDSIDTALSGARQEEQLEVRAS